MKTIEEAAKLHKIATNIFVSELELKVSEKVQKLIDTISENSFRTGVDFANEWISIEEEIPELIDEYALFKRNNSIYGFCVNELQCSIKEWIEINHITHWRKIERL